MVFDVAGELGYEMTDAVHLAMVGSSHEVSNRLLVEAYGVSFPYAMFDQKCREVMSTRLAETVPVKHGATELLMDLKARSIPAAVATSSRAAHAFGHLGRAGLLDMFRTIVTRDDVAAGAVVVLLAPEAHAGRTWDLTGPSALTLDEIAALLSGSPVMGGRAVSFHDETLLQAVVDLIGEPDA